MTPMKENRHGVNRLRRRETTWLAHWSERHSMARQRALIGILNRVLEIQKLIDTAKKRQIGRILEDLERLRSRAESVSYQLPELCKAVGPKRHGKWHHRRSTRPAKA